MGSTRRVYQYTNIVVISCHVLCVFNNRSPASLHSGRQKSKTQGLAKLIPSDSTGSVYPSLFPSFRYFVNKLWYLLAWGHITQISASVFTRQSPSVPVCVIIDPLSNDTSHTKLWSKPMTHLNLVTSSKSWAQIRAHSEVLGVKTSMDKFWENPSQPLIEGWWYGLIGVSEHSRLQLDKVQSRAL